MREDGPSFFIRVYDLVGQIPYGRVSSYGQLAALLGSPRAARQVGWAMRRCPEGLPWHRVARADGSIAAGPWAALQRAMLEEEGVEFTPDGRVDTAPFRWL